MAYSTPYDYNDDSIRHLDEKFGEIDCDRFLYCIQVQQKWDIEKVNNFIAQLRTSHIYASRELDRLRELNKTYNKEYPTNHRRYVTTAQEVVSKMLFESKKIHGYPKYRCVIITGSELEQAQKDQATMFDSPENE